jgi:sulfoxide reductase heme-binding subunit YedZ
MQALGYQQWKYVQRLAYVIFYLVGLHAAYFIFLHYELSLRNVVFQNPPPPDPNWFRFYFVGLVVIVLALQWGAFAKRVVKYRQTQG